MAVRPHVKRNNGKARRVKRDERHALAMATSPRRGTPRSRCLARDKDGHRCRLAPHEGQKVNHTSFGREWKETKLPIKRK